MRHTFHIIPSYGILDKFNRTTKTHKKKKMVCFLLNTHRGCEGGRVLRSQLSTTRDARHRHTELPVAPLVRALQLRDQRGEALLLEHGVFFV